MNEKGGPILRRRAATITRATFVFPAEQKSSYLRQQVDVWFVRSVKVHVLANVATEGFA